MGVADLSISKRIFGRGNPSDCIRSSLVKDIESARACLGELNQSIQTISGISVKRIREAK